MTQETENKQSEPKEKTNTSNEQQNKVNQQQTEEVRKQVIDTIDKIEKVLQENKGAAQIAQKINQLGNIASLLDVRKAEKNVEEVGSNVENILTAVTKGKISGIPEQSEIFFSQLSIQGITKVPLIPPSLLDLISIYIKEEISFSSEGQAKTKFETAIENIIAEDPFVVGSVIRDSLIAMGQDKNEIEKKFPISEEKGDLSQEETQLLKDQNMQEIASVLGKANTENFTTEEKEIWKACLQNGLRKRQLSEEDRKQLKDILIKYNHNDTQATEIVDALGRIPIADTIARFKQLAETHGMISFSKEEYEIIEKYFFNKKGLSDLIKDKVFTTENRIEFKRKIISIFNKLYQRAESDPNKHFSEGFTDFYEGGLFRALIYGLEKLRDESIKEKIKLPEEAAEEKNLTDFLNSFIIEINIERNWREIYHDIWIYAKMPNTFEKWQELIGFTDMSQASIFLSGVDGKAIDLARSVFERYIQFEIAQNGNSLRPDFLAKFYDKDTHIYGGSDYIKIKEDFERVLKASGMEDLDDLAKNRALNIGMGFSFLNTLRIMEIVASSFPPGHLKGNFLYDLAAIFNLQHNWAFYRGEQTREGGDPTMHRQTIAILGEIPVDKTYEKSFLRRLWWRLGRVSKKWVPQEIYDKAMKGHTSKQVQKKMNEIDREWLDSQGDWGKLLRALGIAGFHTRAGWRVNEILADILKTVVKRVNNDKKFESEKEWQWFDKYLIKELGAGACWYTDGSRAQNDFKQVLGKLLEEKKIIKNWRELSDKDWNKIWNNYTGGAETIQIEAFELKGDLAEILEKRRLQYQGYSFYKLLRRSPVDFLVNLSQLMPEVSDKEIGSKKLSGFEYWFTDDPDTLVASDKPEEVEKHRVTVGKFQTRYKAKWGKENFKHLKKVAEFWHKLMQEGKTPEEKNEIANKFKNTMAIALENTKKRTGSEENYKAEGFEIIGKDIEDIGGGNDDIKIAKLLFDKDEGLIPYFEKLGEDEKKNLAVEYKDENKAEKGKIVDNSFFFRLSSIWFNEEQIGIFPNSADINHAKLYEKIALTGENTLRRLVGDPAAWAKIVEGITKLPELLLQVNASKKLDKILELHQHMIPMKNIAGNETMWKAQFYLAQIVAKFFQEHDNTRFPILGVGSLMKLALGRGVSLSKLHFGHDAFTMDSDDINRYFQTLWSKIGAIPEKGQHSFCTLSRALRVDFPKIITTEILPKIAQGLLFLILWRFFSKAKDELEGKQE